MRDPLKQAERLQAWTPERLSWPLLQAVDDSLTEQWARVLRRQPGELAWVSTAPLDPTMN